MTPKERLAELEAQIFAIEYGFEDRVEQEVERRLPDAVGEELKARSIKAAYENGKKAGKWVRETFGEPTSDEH